MKTSVVTNCVSRLLNNIKDHHLIYRNPLLNLQNYLEIPLFKNCELYSPSTNTLTAAENLFTPQNEHMIGSIFKTISTEKLPIHDLPEVAFMGRSNAGKSSLLKAIFRNVPGLNVKTSKKPGNTKCIQFFQVGQKLCLVDMPGYGERQPEWFEPVIINYIKKRKNLVKTFLIIDGDSGIQGLDEVTMELFESYRIPYCIVMTKIDNASDSRRLRNVLFYRQFRDKYKLVSCFPQPFLISSTTYEGLPYFMAFLGNITGSLDYIEQNL